MAGLTARSTTPISATSRVSRVTPIHFTLPFGSDIQNASTPGYARQRMNELRAEDLRFSLAETQAFIEHAIPSTLSPETITRLAGRTEGWAAGLHLVMLALQRREGQVEIQQFLETFTGSLRGSMVARPRAVENHRVPSLALQPPAHSRVLRPSPSP